MNKQLGTKFTLVVYDIIIFLLSDILLYVIYQGAGDLSKKGIIAESVLAFFFIFGIRIIAKIYRQIWRYGGIQCYVRLLCSDIIAFFIYVIVEKNMLPVQQPSFAKILAFCCVNALGALGIRMLYRFAYKCGNQNTIFGKLLRFILKIFTMGRVRTESDPDSQKIRIAIVGAGSVGVGLVDDLMNNPKTQYVPRCFIDSNPDKIGRNIRDLTVVSESVNDLENLKKHHIQEVVFAVPNMEQEKKNKLYNIYKKAGFRLKIFDYPIFESSEQRMQLRNFEIEDLLFRKERNLITDKTKIYYEGKVVLITGGGGSIGTELCRQLAKMDLKQIIILDIYENSAYDIQQELLFAYKDKIDVKIEIVSITNKRGISRVFKKYHPDICIHAAAHKHVPLMEENCIEAVENNVFGTLNVIQCCEEFNCERFMMVSTDKAVNPTNVMGATKRICEMITQVYSSRGRVKCSATRFGNVLGSAGSVIPLFKNQIAAGGPVTVTDKRIIRYFMTIPEASQLVLTCGAMSQNGDLFVLDMGKPIKIWDLAKHMIALSNIPNIKIIETGLRPGEKLYEELLVNKDVLKKTENRLIFIEHEDPIDMETLFGKLNRLKAACDSGSDDAVRLAIKSVVPTFKDPSEVNVG